MTSIALKYDSFRLMQEGLKCLQYSSVDSDIDLSLFSAFIKGKVHREKICNYLLTLMSFQTCVLLFFPVGHTQKWLLFQIIQKG